VQAYLAAGKPILLAMRGDAADLIVRAGAGIVCRPGDPESIAEAVKELVEADPERLAAMGRAGSEFYAKEMSISIGVRKFERVFKEAVEGVQG
jgi:glycosyltransferase involved in cell wall biosynthesis